MPLVTFSPGTIMKSADVDSNFGLCVLTDTSRTVTVTHTYTATQTFTGGWTAAAACSISTGGFTVTAGGITVTGNSSITGTLGVSGILSVTAANVAIQGSGQTTLAQYIDFTNTGGRLQFGIEKSTGGSIIVGSTAYATALTTVGATPLQFGTNQVLGLTLNTANSLVFATAASKIIPGTSSLSLRNNADSVDNLILTDAGNATLRGNLTFASATTKIAVPAGGFTDFRLASDAGSAFKVGDDGSVNVPNGTLSVAPATTARASILMPSGTAPTSPTDGMFWYDGTNLKFRNGVTSRTITWT